MVATDAHRLALVDHPDTFFEEAAWKLFHGGIIVPRKGLNELRRLLSEGQDDFFVSVMNKMLFIKRENIFITMRLIEGKYADYRRIIPETSINPIQLEREEFLSSLRRISLMSSDKSRSVSFNAAPGVLQLSSQSPELGDAKEEMNIDYEKDPLRITFNSRYLMDAISAMEGQKVQMELIGPQNPGVIRSLDGLNHISVVMPMKL